MTTMMMLPVVTRDLADWKESRLLVNDASDPTRGGLLDDEITGDADACSTAIIQTDP